MKQSPFGGGSSESVSHPETAGLCTCTSPPTESHGSDNTAVRPATVATVGNPNTGKSTLFNALTGFRRRVANYPGVSVDVGRGPVRGTARPIELLDLPGTYSLAALSPDEMVVSNMLCGRVERAERPDCILAILDASNLPRNLYFFSQLADIDLPIVVALNMTDIAEARGIAVDAGRLSERLGVPVVPMVATREATVKPLLEALDAALDGAAVATRAQLPEALVHEAAALRETFGGQLHFAEAIRVLLDRDGYAEQQYLERGGDPNVISEARARLNEAGIDGPGAEVRARYAWVAKILDGVISRPDKPIRTASDRLDAVLTHRFGGALALFAVLFVLFQGIFSFATYPMDWIDAAFGSLGGLVGGVLPEGILNSLIVGGLIAGVGGVLVFLPQILILFAFLAVLEDCGYLARAASMMDRVMRAMGLSGRAFIPLLSSFACAIPAIMGTRAIADRRERFVTILITPFMSCSARLPIYLLLITAFVPTERYLGGWVGLQGLVMLAMYLVGVIIAIPIAWLLKKTAFAGPSAGFMLELPSYKWPRPRAIWQRMHFAGKHFLVRAGTVILAVSLVVWALGYFPHSASTASTVRQKGVEQGWDEAKLESELAGAYLRESYLGRMGRTIEPVIKPIGWDWRIGVAIIASFPAREVVIGTMGTIFNLGGDVDEAHTGLRDAIQAATWPDGGGPVFTLPVALSIMVFFALCAQCSSTLVMIGRETGSWVWPVVSFTGMTTIAYFAAWAVAAAARAAGL